ncbi:MAG: ring-cleaving dioxygenase [Bacteroidota bacterium]|nr:ring-cleaving dioxygenase [Bacteroidota bacterium]
MKIKEIILCTNFLDKLKNFYNEILGLEVITNKENFITVKTQFTNIVFRYDPEIKNPFYHFAFNIPENQFKAAKEWGLQRVDLIKEKSKDEFDFTSWNAHSIYFYDPAGNIIELIARHNLNNSSKKEFCGKSLLNVSEIGLPVFNVKKFYDSLNKNFNIPNFSGDMKTFTAAGDDDGLFIIVPEGRKWFPDCPEAKIFPTIIKIISYEESEIESEKLPYKIISTRN